MSDPLPPPDPEPSDLDPTGPDSPDLRNGVADRVVRDGDGDHMPIGVIVATDQGRVLHRNHAAGMFVGARVGQLVVPCGDEPGLFDGVGADQAAGFAAVFAAATAGSSAHCTISAPSDRRRSFRLSVSPAAASTVVITIEDTSELVEAERAARASSRLLEALDAHSEELVLVFDVTGRSRYVSSAVRRHLGDVVIEQAADVLDLVHPHDRPTVDTIVAHIRANPSASDTAEFRLATDPEGSCRWFHATITNLIDDPDIQGFVITMRDVHEHHLAERELRFRATHDALTTLPDRAALQSRIEAILRTGERDGWRTALIFCDLDRFKLINDRAGHRIGDTVLTEVASRLRSALRSSDFVGRFGGDEFVVVAPNVDDEEHAMSLADRIFDEVVGPVRSGEVEVDVCVSMGVAVNDAECTTAAGLLHRADLAMYEAKRLGRGRVTQYSHDLGLGSEEVGTLRADLRTAIDDHQFLMHYQPIVALTDGLASGHESLARWEHPGLGIVTARRFIAIAESAGLIAELGDELVRLACRDVGRAMVAEDPSEDHFVSINLSSAQLSHPDAASSVLDQLRANRVDPHSIVVELTEAAFAQGPTVRANLEAFRHHGVRIFLDDFGVGYSSLSQLRHFPVDGIKIDASIINPIVDVDLVRLIVGVARTLAIRTIAEGVESAEQLDTVRRLGVDYAQGYHLGRPSRSSNPSLTG
jgi:diguanylate cyclase (GGDEF)-like protein/PAS domain S-box-containing protein